MNIPDHIFEILEKKFGLKILQFFDAEPDPIFFSLDPGWKNTNPDPQHCI
jgi:hypothetical protein